MARSERDSSMRIRSFVVVVVAAVASLGAFLSSACGSDASPSEPATQSTLDGGPEPGLDGGTAPGLDGGPGDEDASAQARITLAASQASVLVEGSVTLTATVEGGAATAVEFVEGESPVAVDDEAPFSTRVSYSFLDNGAHTYVARATVGGKALESNTVTVTVDVPPNGVFVHPTAGSDTAAGTQAAPFKTIAKARQSISAGQTIYLNDGTYDTSNQAVMLTTFTAPAFVRGLSPSGARIVGTTDRAFAFTQGGGIRDVTIEGFPTAVQATAGNFTLSNVNIAGASIAIDLRQTVTATIEQPAKTPAANVPAGAFACLALVQDDATVTYRGGGLEGYTGNGPAFFVRGRSTMVLEDVTIKDHVGTAVRVWDTSHVTLRRVTIDHAGASSGSAIERSAIYAGPNNTASPLTTSLVLESSMVTGSTGGAAIGFIQYSIAFTHTLRFTDSHVDGNGAAGVLVSAASPHPDATLAFTSVNSTFDENGTDGIVAPRGTFSLQGGSISKNAGKGLTVDAATTLNAVTIRGTTFDANGGDAVTLNGLATSSLDLGKTGMPGGVVFKGVGASSFAVRLVAPIQGFAVGDTWIPNEQGADAAGRYTAAKTLTSVDVGRNANVAAGASLVVF